MLAPRACIAYVSVVFIPVSSQKFWPAVNLNLSCASIDRYCLGNDSSAICRGVHYSTGFWVIYVLIGCACPIVVKFSVWSCAKIWEYYVVGCGEVALQNLVYRVMWQVTAPHVVSVNDFSTRCCEHAFCVACSLKVSIESSVRNSIFDFESAGIVTLLTLMSSDRLSSFVHELKIVDFSAESWRFRSRSLISLWES